MQYNQHNFYWRILLIVLEAVTYQLLETPGRVVRQTLALYKQEMGRQRRKASVGREKMLAKVVERLKKIRL